MSGASVTTITDTDRQLDDGDQEITRRDYFAAAALTGILANQSFFIANLKPAERAAAAYAAADAMLEARKSNPTEQPAPPRPTVAKAEGTASFPERPTVPILEGDSPSAVQASARNAASADRDSGMPPPI